MTSIPAATSPVATTAVADAPPLTRGRIYGYGIGDFALNLFWSGSAFFLLYWYTDVAGLPNRVAGFLFFFGSVFNLAAQQYFALGDSPLEAFVRGSYHWRDNVIFALDQDPNTRQDSYGLFNLALGLTSTSGRYEVSLYAKNLFDKHFVGSIFDLPFENGGYAQFPTVAGQRVVGVSVSLSAF